MTYFYVILYWEDPENYRFAVLAKDGEQAIAIAKSLLDESGVLSEEDYSDSIYLKAYRLILPDELNPIVYL